ncbi:hypothetical protein [Sporosarcina sp. FSL W7-1283]|uniref:hypothetical protein n=1 Tax=Sporosarcina sp. FSL W7-1283 TaxID=2921560 RepID=UPI0030F52A40
MREMTVTYSDGHQQIKERKAWQINPKLIMLLEPGKLFFMEFNRKVTTSREITDEVKRTYFIDANPSAIQALITLEPSRRLEMKNFKDIEKFITNYIRQHINF